MAGFTLTKIRPKHGQFWVKIGHTAHSLEAVGVCLKKEVKGEGSEILIQNRQQLGQLSAG